MRLHTMARGQSRIARLELAMVGRLGGPALAAAAGTFLYRPAWGRPFASILQSLLRGRSRWSVGERELFAAFVSKLNRCSFCVGAHGGVAAGQLGEAAFRQALNDWRTAPVRPAVRAMLGFLEKLTLSPEELAPADAVALANAGIDERSILDGVYIGWWFNIGNRCADAFGLEQPAPRALPATVNFLLRVGYRV